MAKKVLLINSNAMFEDSNNNLFVYDRTGEFMLELSERYSVTNFHFKEQKKASDTINNFNLSNTNIFCRYIRKDGFKVLEYIKAYLYCFYLIFRTDYLYLFYPNNFKYICIFCVLINKPFGLYVRGQKKINSRFSKFLYKHSSFINTVSPFFTNEIKKYNQNVNTIRPMINYEISDLELFKEYKVNGCFNLLFVGRLEKDKGVFELIDAIHAICKKNAVNLKLNLVGDGSSYLSLKKYVHDLGLKDVVCFSGSIFDPDLLRQVYLKSDIFILPTYHEGFPRVLYEAMIFNVPIITTFVGGIPSLMIDKYNCLQIKVKSKSDICDKVLFLINDFEFAKNLAANANSDVNKYLFENNKSHFELVVDSI
ncbi:glycosyltransferase family 4 protein [Algoriphagus sp.]|uniref:glycosyltransferase family 4 protein n=1 Tax=Algoriphagus sp. TaxID=1872435 RepID=UPI0026219E04|nr:glycosyltransferase family 4 protein [Algoriphagus sp.]